MRDANHNENRVNKANLRHLEKMSVNLYHFISTGYIGGCRTNSKNRIKTSVLYTERSIWINLISKNLNLAS